VADTDNIAMCTVTASVYWGVYIYSCGWVVWGRCPCYLC
jgi:hypothetical protein